MYEQLSSDACSILTSREGLQGRSGHESTEPVLIVQTLENGCYSLCLIEALKTGATVPSLEPP